MTMNKELPVIYTDRSRIETTNLQEILASDRAREKFDKKIIVSNDPDACWGWTDKPNGRGYTNLAVYIKGRRFNVRGHRASYFFYYGIDPKELLVCHTCDNPICTNPKHLFLGTGSDNIQDALSKGRTPIGDNHYSRKDPSKLARGDDHWARKYPDKVRKGEACNLTALSRQRKGELNPKAKLTAADVKQIRYMYAAGMGDQRELANTFGIRQSSIWAIINRKTWRHL